MIRNNSIEKLRFIEKALNYTRVGLIVTDPSQDDNPIVYTNKGFLDISGYDEDEILGKNCRFLQGKDTSASSVADLRNAIKNRVPITTQILNYKKDGTPFWNELSVDPLFIEEENKTYFVGVQKDVTVQRRQHSLLNESYQQMAELSTPIVPIKDGVSVLPIIGQINDYRFNVLIETVSNYIVKSKDDYFIVDLSGLLEIDTFVADCIFKLNNLISLTGTKLIITGITPLLALKMAELRVDFDNLTTYNNVKSALKSL